MSVWLWCLLGVLMLFALVYFWCVFRKPAWYTLFRYTQSAKMNQVVVYDALEVGQSWRVNPQTMTVLIERTDGRVFDVVRNTYEGKRLWIEALAPSNGSVAVQSGLLKGHFRISTILGPARGIVFSVW